MGVADAAEPAVWRRMLDTIGEAVIATDLTGVVTFWNAAAARLYGWSPDEAVGANIVDLTPAPTSREQAKEIMARMAQGESWTGRFDVQSRNGTTFPALVTNAPLLDADGALVGVVGVSADLTNLAEVEARARHGRRQAAVANLAELALDQASSDELVERAAGELAEEIDAPFVLYGEPTDAGRLRVLASFGFRPDLFEGRDVVWPDPPVPGHGPQVVFASEETIGRNPLLRDHGVVAGITVPVAGGLTPALLGVYLTRPRTIEPDEISFVLSVAGVLGGARVRNALDRQLHAALDRLRASDEHRVGSLLATDHEPPGPLPTVRAVAETLRDGEGRLDADERRRLLDVLVVNAERLDRLIGDLRDMDGLSSGPP